MKSARQIVVYTVFIFATLLSDIGCGQKTNAPVNQNTGQSTPTTTDQDAATQGSQVYVYVVNAPGSEGLPQPGAFQADAGGGSIETTTGDVTNAAGGNAVKDAKAGYAQAGFTINITTGGTAPSLTGSATGSSAQTPTLSSAVSPTQHIDPRISASVPIALAMPGGMNDQQATAATEGSTANPTKTSENELRWQKLEATANRLETLMPLLEQMFAPALPATPPPVVPVVPVIPVPTEANTPTTEPVNDGAGG